MRRIFAFTSVRNHPEERMKSMTALSTASLSEQGIRATVEIRTVNGRYLEISCRLPKQLSHKEIELRELLRSVIGRGTVQVTVKTDSDSPLASTLNLERLEAYWQQLEKAPQEAQSQRACRPWRSAPHSGHLHHRRRSTP